MHLIAWRRVPESAAGDRAFHAEIDAAARRVADETGTSVAQAAAQLRDILMRAMVTPAEAAEALIEGRIGVEL